MTVSKEPATTFQRAAVSRLLTRLREPRRFLQVVAGPRQVGKTTAVLQALERLERPAHYASADDPGLQEREWLRQQWQLAREKGRAAVLVLDEIQKIRGWAETVKALWDEDTRARRRLRVVILGSAPLLVERGLGESLAGRFEVLPMSHWSFSEMAAAFRWDFERYVLFGGYPGAARLTEDPERWRRYILDALIETTLSRDILLMTRVDKPALLRRLFGLGCAYSGQVLSYTKMLGQLTDAGNTTTLAHYLDLLSGAGMVTGIGKFSRGAVRIRASSPKLIVRNTALATALSRRHPREIRADPAAWGRWVESAVGAHLVNTTAGSALEVFYWRDPKGREVDFIVTRGRSTVAIEVKSGRDKGAPRGLAAFADTFRPLRTLTVGAGGVALEEFLGRMPEEWFR